MKKLIILLGLLGLVALQSAYSGPRLVRADNKPTPGTPKPCQKNHPSKDCGSAVIVMAYSGTFRVSVAQTKLVLTGHASKTSHGTQIFAQRVVASHTPSHSVAFRVFAIGHLPPLSLLGHGQLYKYAVGRNAWSAAKTVTKSGIYAGTVK